MSDDEAARLAHGHAPGPAAAVLREGHGARRRGPHPRGGGGARGGRGERRRGRPAAHRLRPGDLLHHRAGRGLGQPGPLRRHPLRALRPRRRRCALGNYLATRGRGFGAEVKRRIMLGTYALSAGYYDAFYLKAQKVRTLIKADFDHAFGWVDALVAPTSPTVAFPLGARLDDPVSMYLSDACTLPVNIAGLPGLSVPCGLSDGPAGRAPVHRPGLGRGRALPPRPRLRGDHGHRRLAPPRAARPGGARGPRHADADGAHGGPNHVSCADRPTLSAIRP